MARLRSESPSTGIDRYAKGVQLQMGPIEVVLDSPNGAYGSRWNGIVVGI